MVFFGSYEVLETVAVGSTGTVFRARHREIGRLAAIKELNAVMRAVPGLLARFRAEAQTLAALDDEHVVAVFDFVEEPERVWIAQEWVDGVTIAALLTAHGRLTAEQSLGVLRGALLGLAHAHDRNLVHRDFAPANILADQAGTSKLVDFGLAAPVGGTGACGTPAFMSPEAARGGPVGKSSDVYSAAAVLFSMLSGRLPFSARSADEVMRAQIEQPAPAVTGHGPAMADLVAGAMSKDQSARPPDARTFLARMEDAARQRYGADWLQRASVTGLVSAATAGAATLTATTLSATSTGGSSATAFLDTGTTTGSAATAGTTTSTSGTGAAALAARRAVAEVSRHWAISAAVAVVALAATAVVVVTTRVASSPTSRKTTPAPTRTQVAALTHLSDQHLATTVSALCATAAKAQLGPLALDITVAGYRGASTRSALALRALSTQLRQLAATAADAFTVGALAHDAGNEVAARNVVMTALGRQAAVAPLDLNSRPPAVASAYLGVISAYLATGRDAITAGVPACAIPLRTESPGPGVNEASGADAVARISSPCPAVSVGYTYYGVGGPPQTGQTLVVSPGEGAVRTDGKAYDNSSGPLSFHPGRTDVALVHNFKEVITGLTCLTTAPPRPAPKWADAQLTITAQSLGGVRLGMTLQQAQAAAGVVFDGSGDGASYPTSLPANYPHLYVHAETGGRVTCLGADGPSTAQTIVTPEGLHLGDTVAKLLQIYGSRARYVPAAAQGIHPSDGYVVAGPGGNLVFSTRGTSTVRSIVAGGPDLVPGTCGG